jgi:hypothetical protein
MASVDQGMVVVMDKLVEGRRKVVQQGDSIAVAGSIRTDSLLVLRCIEVAPSDLVVGAFDIVTTLVVASLVT